MTQFISDMGSAHGLNVTWQQYPSKHVIVHAPAGSYAARRASIVLREAEQVAEAVDKLVDPTNTPNLPQIPIYLTDSLVDEGNEVEGYGARSAPLVPAPFPLDAIVQIVSPESPGESLTRPLVRRLMTRYLGENAAKAQPLLDGFAGVIAARTGTGSSIAAANELVRAELDAGRSVSIFSASTTDQADGEGLQRPETQAIATSFVAYLIDSFEVSTVCQFLREYDPTRRDHAATAAFRRPLGTLEEAWRVSLRRTARRRGTLRILIDQLIPLLRPYWRRLVAVLGYMIIGIALNIAVPLAGKYLFDVVIPSNNFTNVGFFTAVLFSFYILSTLTNTRRTQVNAETVQRILVDLQERIFAHLQRLPHSFYGQAKVGDLMSRFSSDLRLVEQALTQLTSVGVFNLLNAIAAGVALLMLSPLIGGLTIIVVPILLSSFVILGGRFGQASYQRQKLTGEAAAAVQENISAHAVIKAFGLEEHAMAAYHARLMVVLKSSVRLTVVGALFETSVGLGISLGQLIVLSIGAVLVISDQVTIGTLLASFGLLPQLFLPVAMLGSVVQTIQTASGSMTRIQELLDEPVTIADAPAARPLPPLRDAIQFEQVRFGYDPDRPILRDLTLRLPAGRHIAIVGPSGAGKSTLAALLLRFWDPQQGTVRFDSHDLRAVTLASLRRQIAIVFQDTFIFDTTVRENIAIGRPDASDAEVIAAARAAQLDHFIQTLPAGYDTVLGERGVRMSGGQRQRLAIARALLRAPELLVLDEATSALDAPTERELLTTLATVVRGRTTISITHRLALAALADEVVVLAEGRVVEQGPPQQLLAAGGFYQRLYAEQNGLGEHDLGSAKAIERAALRAVPMFAEFSDEALGRLAQQLTRERYAANQEVVIQNEVGEKLYIIESGQVEVLVTKGGTERWVNTLSGGDYFGEMALLSSAPRIATVRTTMPTSFYSLARADFLALLKSEPSVERAVHDVMARRRASLDQVIAAAS